MPDAYQKDRYSRSTILKFGENQQNRVEATALTTQQIQVEELFKDVSAKPDGPIDILYHFKDEPQAPALGFQQVDGDQDQEEMYLLAYRDPSLDQEWKLQVEQRS